MYPILLETVLTTTPQGLSTSPCPLFVTELFCAPSLNRQAFIVVQ